MMGGYGYGFGGWMMLMLLFWVFVIALIVWLVLTVARSQSQSSSRDSAARGGLGILQERLARGEIDADEYRQRRAVLEEGKRATSANMGDN